MPRAIAELRNIDFVRGENRILSDISWRILRGQHWALLGANGSGKTSLLRVLTGEEWPTSGEVHVLGKRFGECDLRDLRRHIGWVSSALVQRMHREETVLGVVLSGFEASIGLYREFTAAEFTAARRALRAVNAAHLEDRPHGTLSQGEQQRVLIARALVHRPPLLILDEACAGLDPVAREHLLGDLARMVRRHDAPTVIMVTHHIEEVGPWITHALVLGGGASLAMGKVHDTISSKIMSHALGRRCTVEHRDGNFALRLGLRSK